MHNYTTPEMAHIWSDNFKYTQWWNVEHAAMVHNADAPEEAVASMEDIARIPTEHEIRRYEQQTHHDVDAFVRALQHWCIAAQYAPWVHHKLTSSDVVDTALAMQVNASTEILRQSVGILRDQLKTVAVENRDVLRAGRTHGQVAEPTTLGHQLGVITMQIHRWYVRTGRTLHMPGKISGPVGTNSGFTPEEEVKILRTLGFRENVSSPVCTQVVPRDFLAHHINELALLASIIDSFAVMVRLGQQSEVDELAEPRADGATGSSSMSHKRNPVRCERLSGLARGTRQLPAIFLEQVALWGERDISNSSVERVYLPLAFQHLAFMVQEATEIVTGLYIDPLPMYHNLVRAEGWWTFQETNQLIADGFDRDKARQRALQSGKHRSPRVPEHDNWVERLYGQ